MNVLLHFEHKNDITIIIKLHRATSQLRTKVDIEENKELTLSQKKGAIRIMEISICYCINTTKY